MLVDFLKFAKAAEPYYECYRLWHWACYGCSFARICSFEDHHYGVTTMSLPRTLTAFVVGAIFFSIPASSDAAQRTVVTADGKTHIVHDELGPVIMHRVLPPYKGIHIHQSELKRQQTGRRR